MKVTGIYARVSTEEQAKSGYSLQDQIRACRKLAVNEDVIEYIDEGVSGEVLDRPELTRLRSDIRSGKIVKVICLDPDRLSRKLVNQLLISEEIEKKAKLLFVNGEYKNTAEGRLFYQLRGAISEFEKAKINERMSRGRKEKARQGYVVRDYRIYGYDYNQHTKSFVINTFEAEIVKSIFRLFTENNTEYKGINGIARFLNLQGIPTKRGAPLWHRQVVRQILGNRAYIGEFFQNRWNSEGVLLNRYSGHTDRISIKERPKEEWILVPCPPIVDKEVFFYAQELLSESRRRWAGICKNRYLLSGILKCGTCGNTLTGRQANHWGKKVSEYSDIKGTAGAKNKGCGRRIKAKTIESAVWDTVLGILTDQKNMEETCIQEQVLKPASNNLLIPETRKRLSEIKRERLHLIKTLPFIKDELGDRGLEDIRGKLREFKEEEDKLENLLKKAEDQAENRSNTDNTDLISKATLYYLSPNVPEVAFEHKRQLIRYLVKEIIVEPDEIRILGF